MRKLFFIAALAAMFVFTGCSKDEEGISFSKDKITLTYGETTTLSLQGADLKDASISYTKERIALLTPDGNLSPLKVGETTIKAAIGNDTAKCVVVINPSVFMYDEPCVNFNATMNDVKAFEKRKIYKETTTQIAYHGENSNVRYVFYTFKNGVLIGSCVMIANTTDAASLTAKFLQQRYDLDFMYDDIISFKTDMFKLTVGYDDALGFNCLYYPITSKSASKSAVAVTGVAHDGIIFN